MLPTPFGGPPWRRFTHFSLPWPMALGSRHSGMTMWKTDIYMLRDVPSARCVSLQFYLDKLHDSAEWCVCRVSDKKPGLSSCRDLWRNTVGFCCCFVVEPLFFSCSRQSAFALLVAPYFTYSVAPCTKLSRPRHHALGGTSLAPSPVHSFKLANLQDDSKRPRVPVCFSYEHGHRQPLEC